MHVTINVVLAIVCTERHISSKCGKMGVVLSLFAPTTVYVCMNVIGIQINTKKRRTKKTLKKKNIHIHMYL